jgi:transcriptional regulator with XRE-family HTH domain
MIKNNQQYEYSKECANKFKYSIDLMDKDEEYKNNDFQRWELNRSALQSHFDKLIQEINEYEILINCSKNQPIKVKVENFNKLPDTLMKARIAANMTQKELADILGLDETRIKLYEERNYRQATFNEILEISTVLGVEFVDAFVKVDFDEIEECKKIAQTLRSRENKQINVEANVF